MKVYLESSVLTDWLFLRRVTLGSVRRALGVETRASYKLMKGILAGKYSDEFYTSYWAIMESLQNYLRSFAMFNMLFDNLSLKYYEVVREYPRYKLTDRAFWQVASDVYQTLDDAQKRKRITVRPEDYFYISKFLNMGFDAVDAKHLIVANEELECDIFVTKDRDFHDRRKDLKKLGLSVEYPGETMALLTLRSRHAPQTQHP
jgi:hypothetical protein